MTRPNWLNAEGVATVVGVVLFWQLASTAGLLPTSAVPSPMTCARELWRLTASGELAQPLLHTLTVVIVAAAIAMVAGVALGTALGLSSFTYGWSMASVDFLRTIPIVALLPVAVLLWGPTTKSELVATAYAATWVMTINTAGAFRSVHPRLGDVGRTFGLPRWRIVTTIWLPAIGPSLLVGARLAVVNASLVAIIAETLVNPQGLGWELIRAQQALRPGQLWAYALLAGLFGYLLNVLLIQAVRLVTPGGRDNPALNGVRT